MTSRQVPGKGDRAKTNQFPVTITFSTTPTPWHEELLKQYCLIEHNELLAMAEFDEEASAGRCGSIRLIEEEEWWRKTQDGKFLRYSKKRNMTRDSRDSRHADGN